MSVKSSSGLVNNIIWDSGVASQLNMGVIKLYSGLQPNSPDLAPNGEHIATIGSDGIVPVSGNSFGVLRVKRGLSAGSLQMNGNWTVIAIRSGIPKWWRWSRVADSNLESEALPRVDGMVGESLILPETFLIAGAVIPVSEFNINILKNC